jgi:hypothetical protein
MSITRWMLGLALLAALVVVVVAVWRPGRERASPAGPGTGPREVEDARGATGELQAPDGAHESDRERVAVEVATTGPGAGAESSAEVVQASSGLALAGRVLDPNGEPVEGAEVWNGALVEVAAARGGAARTGLVSTHSGPEGRFELEGLDPGTVRVTALADGFAPSETAERVLEAGFTPSGVVLRLRVGARIHGEVFRPDGSPAAGRELQLASAEHAWFFHPRADEGGRFDTPHLPPGRWRVDTYPGPDELRELGLDGAASLSGFEHLSTAVVELLDGEEAFLTLGLDAPTSVRVHGRVLLGEEGVPGILQWTPLGVGGAAGMVIGRAAADGSYEVTLERPGAWDVAFAATGTIGPGRAELGALVPATPEYELDLSLPAGAIAGRVTRVDGEPQYGAELTLRVVEGERHRSPLSMPGDVRNSDVEGHYEFLLLPPGTYAIHVRGRVAGDGVDAPLAGAVRREVVVRAGQRTEDVDFVLMEGTTLTGRVLDAAGVPVRGSAVLLFHEDGTPVDAIASLHSEPDGAFETPPLAPGVYDLVARRAGEVSSPLLVVVPPAAGEPVELVLHPGADLVVDWSADGLDPRMAYPFVVANDVGGRTWSGLRDQRTPFDWRVEPEDPHLPRVGPLPPGTYRVTARLSDGRRGEASISVLSDGERRVELALE